MNDLKIVTVYQNNLDLERFSLMLDKNAQCYKFYWLEALVNLLVKDGKKDIAFEEAAIEMVLEAWYTISEYHLHMGSLYGGESKNAIERAVKYIQSSSGLSSSAGRDRILAAVDRVREDPDFQKILLQMTDDVPYRLLSPFVPELKGNDRLWHSDRKLIDYFRIINEKSGLPYYMEYRSHTDKYVHWNDSWAEMVKDNYIIILEWIRARKIRYLQDRNPGVPGIVYKLDISSARKLDEVHHLWDAVMEKEDVIDIYSRTVLNGKRYDIDHFIPWSYVTTDELWNLTPSEKKVNIMKSNHLPDWDVYFSSFVENQIQLHDHIMSDEYIRRLFEKCRNKNLNTLWASDLYNMDSHEQFRAMLNENMKPVYNAAKLQGYSLWSI